jgi:hypothetical protein
MYTVFSCNQAMHYEKMKIMGRMIVATERNAKGVPKLRNIATVEEMAHHGYNQKEIDDEIQSRMIKDENRRIKKIKRDMPAYLRHEVSGARRQEARKIKRILLRKEKKRLRNQTERELRLGLEPGTLSVRGEEDTDVEDNDDNDDDSDDDENDNKNGSDGSDDQSDDESDYDSDDYSSSGTDDYDKDDSENESESDDDVDDDDIDDDEKEANDCKERNGFGRNDDIGDGDSNKRKADEMEIGKFVTIGSLPSKEPSRS